MQGFKWGHAHVRLQVGARACKASSRGTHMQGLKSGHAHARQAHSHTHNPKHPCSPTSAPTPTPTPSHPSPHMHILTPNHHTCTFTTPRLIPLPTQTNTHNSPPHLHTYTHHTHVRACTPFTWLPLPVLFRRLCRMPSSWARPRHVLAEGPSSTTSPASSSSSSMPNTLPPACLLDLTAVYVVCGVTASGSWCGGSSSPPRSELALCGCGPPSPSGDRCLTSSNRELPNTRSYVRLLLPTLMSPWGLVSRSASASSAASYSRRTHGRCPK